MPELREAVIYDVDGTLCDVRGIRHLLDGPGRFAAFHSASVDCPPHPHVVEAARADHAAGRAVLIVTGREARWRHHTAMWLALAGVPSDAMWMRAYGDYRPDYEVKADVLAAIRRRYRLVAAWDDNPAVIRLWRQHDIPVHVVPGWDGPAIEEDR